MEGLCGDSLLEVLGRPRARSKGNVPHHCRKHARVRWRAWCPWHHAAKPSVARGHLRKDQLGSVTTNVGETPVTVDVRWWWSAFGPSDDSGSVRDLLHARIGLLILASRFPWLVGHSDPGWFDLESGRTDSRYLDFAGKWRSWSECSRRRRRPARHGCRAGRRARRQGSILCWGWSDSGTLSTLYRRAIHSTSRVHPSQIHLRRFAVTNWPRREHWLQGHQATFGRDWHLEPRAHGPALERGVNVTRSALAWSR